MEEQLLQILNTIQPLGWPAVGIIFVIKGLPLIVNFLERKFVTKVPPQTEFLLEDIKENHLHELKNCIEKLGSKLDTLNTTLARIEGTLNENSRDTAYIKARINNR